MLLVPEHHDQPAGPTVTVAYAVVHHSGPTAKPDPVLWLDYDAGEGFLADRINRVTDGKQALLADRDIVVLDFRGTGTSKPALDCPEVSTLQRTTFASTVDESSPQGRALLRAAVTQCHDRLVAAGVDLTAYNTDESAADLDGLRQALGYRSWDIIAGQYGVRVALKEMQEYPATVRAAVLVGAVAPDGDRYLAAIRGTDQAFSSVTQDCQADAGCHAAFPDPAADLRAVVARVSPTLHLNPGDPTSFLFDPARVQEEVRTIMSDSTFVDWLPYDLHGPNPFAGYLGIDMVANVNAYIGRTLWNTVPAASDSDHGAFFLGAYLSVVCREDVPFTDPAALATAASGSFAAAALGDPGDLDECAAWKVPAASAVSRAPSAITQPTIVFHGAYDPTSSTGDAQQVARELQHGFEYEVPGVSTYPTYVNPTNESTASQCALAIRNGFIDDPSRTPDSSCLAAATGAAFQFSAMP
jgi:pimeloyl-ACP methyl ester carboxylesterase